MQQDVKITADRLFALLRIALLDSDNEFHHFANIDNGEWEALYNLALSQGVHAIAYDAMRKLPEEYQADIDLKVQWAYNVNHAEERYKTTCCRPNNNQYFCKALYKFTPSVWRYRYLPYGRFRA